MTKKLPSQKSRNNAATRNLPTFLDHLHELRNRLFWSVGFMVVASAAAFPLKEHIIALLMAPLGSQALYYLTPVGGFSFILKICTYTGLLFALPVVLFNVYRFLEPLMSRRRHSVLGFVFFSALLTGIGVLFAYMVSLPAALHFLTNLNIGQIHAMLTADAYLSFVITYLLGTAILFQIPLILLIINSIRPLPPGRLMGAQRYVIVGAFIIAAIISPTPDILNQALLALPIVGMFQVGVVCVWVQNNATRRKRPKTTSTFQPVHQPLAPAAAKRPDSPTLRRGRPIYDIVPRTSQTSAHLPKKNVSPQPLVNSQTAQLRRPPPNLW